jgi:hypothetical protein
MVLPDLSKVQSGGTFCIDSCMSVDEICSLSDTVDDYYDHVVAMCLRKLNNEVNTDGISSIFWSF